jgi:hypothetical protein
MNLECIFYTLKEVYLQFNPSILTTAEFPTASFEKLWLHFKCYIPKTRLI